MNNERTLGIRFVSRNSKSDKNLVNLFIRITVDKKMTEVSLKKTVKKSSWNQSRSVAKGSSPASKRLNSFLDELRTLVVNK